MNATFLRAHFDGKKIVLDEPIDLKPNTKLIVAVLPESETDQNNKKTQQEREAWLQISMQALENAYSENEVEYSSDLIKVC